MKKTILLSLPVYLLTTAMIVATISCNMGENKTDNVTIEPKDKGTEVMQQYQDNTTVAKDSSVKDTVMMNRKESLKKSGKGKATILAINKNNAAMEMDKEGVYANTEIRPAFPGGQKALEYFFQENIIYPEKAAENATEAIVEVGFAVDENGKLYSPHILGKKAGDGLDEEALRVVSKMPSWTPGRIKGKNVKSYFTLPIRFELD